MAELQDRTNVDDISNALVVVLLGFLFFMFSCSGFGVKVAEGKQATIRQMPQAALVVITL